MHTIARFICAHSAHDDVKGPLAPLPPYALWRGSHANSKSRGLVATRPVYEGHAGGPTVRVFASGDSGAGSTRRTPREDADVQRPGRFGVAEWDQGFLVGLCLLISVGR